MVGFILAAKISNNKEEKNSYHKKYNFRTIVFVIQISLIFYPFK